MEKESSTDPEDVTFSYQVPDDSSIWGPYCFHCMNHFLSMSQISNITLLYLHFHRCAIPYKLDKLIEINGPDTPFTFHIPLSEEIRRNTCMNERCRRTDNAFEETSFFSVTSPRGRAEIIQKEEEENTRMDTGQGTHPQKICLLEEQPRFQKLPCNAYEDDVEKNPTVMFKTTGSEVDMGQQGAKLRAVSESAIQSCSSVLEVSDLQGSEDQVDTHSLEQEETCSLVSGGRTVSHMHLPSPGEEFLSPEELSDISSQTYKALMLGRRCFRTKYRAIKLICVSTCYVCGFRPRCTCEYTLHIFSPLHCGVLARDKTPISRESFNFWLEQMVELRQQSPHPFPNLQLDLTGPATLKYRESRALLPILEIGADLFPELPVSCKIRSDAATLVFMNTDTTSKDLVLEENYLLRLTEAIRVHSYSTCYKPTAGCPFIRQYCPEVCDLCGFVSKCACRYIFHLFGHQHVSSLNKNKIKVSLVDIHFWLGHLVSFAKLDINYRMRSILEPLTSLGPPLPSSQYCLHTKTPSTLPPVTPQNNPACILS